MQKATIDTERLLEHRGFLLRLARGLTRDEASAEDLVQETWLAALRRPPRHDRGLGAWLGRIARRLASNRGRAAATRAERERRSARPEALEADRDLEGQLELQRDIVDALRELREPYRRTLYLRYYRDLTPSEIAGREGLPLPTVKSQLQRGLAELRTALDRRHGGQRALWLAPLADFLGRGTETTAAAATVAGWTGGMLAVQKLVLAAFAFAIVGGLWFVVNRSDQGIDPEGEAEAGEPPSVSIARPEANAPTARTEAGSNATRAEVEPAAAAESVTRPAVVTGRLVFESGAPAPGIEVTMRRWLAYDPDDLDRERRLDPPTPVHTDLEGRFEFAMALAEPIGLYLEAHLEGHVPVRWLGLSIDPASRLTVSEKTLALGGSLLVSVRDLEGKVVAGDWKIYVDPTEEEDPSWEGLSLREELDRATGDVRIGSIPGGRVRVRASSGLVDRRAERHMSRIVEVAPGEELPLLLTYEGPKLDRRIVVDWEIRPRVTNMTLLPTAWRLEGAGEAPRFPETSPLSDVVFGDLTGDAYTLECLDPRFEAWRREGIAPGTLVEARLRGRSALRLEVLDAEGERKRDYELTLVETREDGTGHRVDLREAKEEEPEDAIYRGLLPTALDPSIPESVLPATVRRATWSIEVRTEDHAPAFVALERLLPDEITPLTVRLSRGTTIAGRVLSANGTIPESEVVVVLTPGALPAFTGMKFSGGGIRWQGEAVPPAQATTTIDERGRFHFGSITPGEWTLRAVQGPWLIVDETLDVAQGESAEVELVMPPAASLAVSFVAPREADLTEVSLELNASDDPAVVPWSGKWSERYSAMERGEACLFEPVMAGDYFLRLIVPCHDRTGMTTYGSNRVLQELTLAPGERRELHCDLTVCFPAFLGLRVTLDGSPRFKVLTAPHPLGDSEITRATGEGNLWGLTSDAGEDFPHLIFPGSYGIDIYSEDGRWGYSLPEPIELRAAETRIVELELSSIEGTVVLVDDTTGKPLVSCPVAWFLEDSGRSRVESVPEFATDTTGRLELRFPVGELGLRVEGYAPVRLRWPPPAGQELRLRATE